MSYEIPQSVRLEGAELAAARGHVANAAKELEALGKLVAKSLGKSDDAMDLTKRIVNVDIRLPSSVPVVTTLCDYTTGECIGVWDDTTGTCRPCGPGDTGCTPHPHQSGIPDPDVIIK